LSQHWYLFVGDTERQKTTAEANSALAPAILVEK